MRAVVVLLLLLAVPVRAAEPVDVALVLVSDVSRSVDDAEFRLQKEGYAAAFNDPRVVAAIKGGAVGAVAVAYVEFAGAFEVRTVMDWRVVRDASEIRAMTDAIVAAPRSFWGRTSISAGIDRGVQMLADAPVEAERRVIDVAGDGTNNSGRDVEAARDDALRAGITVNGLAIINEHPVSYTFAHVQPPGGLTEWYRNHVIGGPGSFVVEVHEFHAFGEAMTRKLINEIAALPSPRPGATLMGLLVEGRLAPADGGVMEERNVGRSGLRVSAIGLGCNNFGWRIDLEASRRVIDAAIEGGITLFDTADIYGDRGGSETVLGEVLGARRKDIVLATKFTGQMDAAGRLKGASRRYVASAVEASLKRLRTDWIDLYQQHQPDPLTPIEETLRALDDLQRAGKIRYYGCSNFPAWQVTEAAFTARAAGASGFVSCQDEMSLLARRHEAELLPAMRAAGLGLLPYFPLASGLLERQYKRDAPMPAEARLTNMQQLADRYLTERNWEVAQRLGDFAAARGHSLLELAFSWLLAKAPVASVIAGATKPEQVTANVRAGDWRLSAEELAEIDAITGAPG